MSAAAIRVPAEFTAVDKFTSVVKKMTAGVSRFTKDGISAMERFDSKINRSISGMNKISKLAVGLGIGALFTQAIQGNIKFNDSLASVSAITGAVGDDLVKLETLAKNTAKVSKKTGADVLKGYELVGSAQPELLKNLDALDAVTRSAVTLSKASRLDLEPAVKSLTDVMNQFDLTDSGKTIDVLAAGAKEGAAAIPLINDALLKFGPTAKGFNVSLENSVAVIETFAKKGLKGAEAGTKIRNILTKMSTIKALPKEAITQMAKFGVNTDIVSDSTLPLSDRLKELSKISGDATAMVKVFGAENKDAGSILLNNIPLYEDLNSKMDQNGLAASQAATNSGTFKFALESIKNSFVNATTATNSNSISMELLLGVMEGLSNHMDVIVGVLGVLIIAYGTLKGVLIATKVVTAGYNLVLGINTAITQSNKKALIGNVAAQSAYKVAMAIGTGVTWLATAATTAFGIALNLGLWPIVLIVAAIAGLIALIMNWSSVTAWFGKQWEKFTNWIGELWQNVVKWFTEFDFMAFFKGIGQSILKFMLMPMIGLLTLLSKIPGKIGEMASLGLEKIGEITGDIDASVTNDKLPSPETQQAKLAQATAAESKLNGSLDVTIKDKGGNVENVSSGSGNLPINLTPIQGMIAG